VSLRESSGADPARPVCASCRMRTEAMGSAGVSFAPGSCQTSDVACIVASLVGGGTLELPNEPRPITTGEGVMSGELGHLPRTPESGGQLLVVALVLSWETLPAKGSASPLSSMESLALSNSSTSSGFFGKHGNARPSAGVSENPFTEATLSGAMGVSGSSFGRFASATYFPQRVVPQAARPYW
jgi:hypothetical protein